MILWIYVISFLPNFSINEVRNVLHRTRTIQSVHYVISSRFLWVSNCIKYSCIPPFNLNIARSFASRKRLQQHRHQNLSHQYLFFYDDSVLSLKRIVICGVAQSQKSSTKNGIFWSFIVEDYETISASTQQRHKIATFCQTITTQQHALKNV